MSDAMQSLTIRIPLYQISKVESIAKQQAIPKSQAFRQVIQRGLSANTELNQKILIEMLMILRSTIVDDTQYEKILQTIDEFKTVQELGDE